MQTASVKQFRPAAELVTSRNREDALKAMVPRLLEMAERAKAFGARHHSFGDGSYMFASFEHDSMPGATYVDVRLSTGTTGEVFLGPKVFSAWLNCPPTWPGKYMNGKVHIMAWRRGWERALVDVRRVPQ